MKTDEKRRFCGCFMPNIFFFLQVAIILLLLLIALQTISIFELGVFAVYVYICMALVAILYCVALRKRVIKRQYQHCDEYAKQKKNKERFGK